jgi:hypothetical protein
MNDPALTPTKSVITSQLDDGDGVLVDLDTKQYYQLNETAMVIWQGLEKRKPLEQIVEELVTSYDVSQEHALASIQSLLKRLQDQKLVRPAE